MACATSDQATSNDFPLAALYKHRGSSKLYLGSFNFCSIRVCMGKINTVAIDTEKIGGDNSHKTTIATDRWKTEAQTDYCHRTHTCLLPRLFRPSPPPVIACKNWRRASPENEGVEAKYILKFAYSTLPQFYNFIL